MAIENIRDTYAWHCLEKLKNQKKGTLIEEALNTVEIFYEDRNKYNQLVKERLPVETVINDMYLVLFLIKIMTVFHWNELKEDERETLIHLERQFSVDFLILKNSPTLETSDILKANRSFVSQLEEQLE